MAFDRKRLEGGLAAFGGDPAFLLAEIFPDQRFPNVVVALDGTVLATWGASQVVVRRSEDGGRTWGPVIPIGPGIHAGGATVDEGTGDVLVFVHPEHPPKDRSTAGRTMYRSGDAGRTWAAEEAAFGADEAGHVPSLHMAECGITLRHGAHAGRLLRPARVYASPQGYNTAIYSDDHGRSWTSSAAFPVDGTGEGCVAELGDGRVLYSSRRHWFGPGEPLSA